MHTMIYWLFLFILMLFYKKNNFINQNVLNFKRGTFEELEFSDIE